MHKIKSIKFKYFAQTLLSETQNIFFFLEPFVPKSHLFRAQACLKRSFFFSTIPNVFFKNRLVSGGGSLLKWIFKLKNGFRCASFLLKKTASILFNHGSYLSSCKILELFFNSGSEKNFTYFILMSFKPSLTKSGGLFHCAFSFLIRSGFHID